MKTSKQKAHTIYEDNDKSPGLVLSQCFGFCGKEREKKE